MATPIISMLAGPVIDGVAKIISLFKVDPNLALQKQTELAEIQLQMQTAAAAAISQQLHDQSAINLVEAGSANFFIAGWRPAVGWACVVAFITNFLILPGVNIGLSIAGKQANTIPGLDVSDMMPVLLGLLGLGGMRTYEKIKGINAGQ